MSIVVENLCKSFGLHTVLDGISETFPGQSISVLLGASGCGKSTTLRCIAGLEKPTSGRIRLGERVVYQDAPFRSIPVEKRQVGMVFQSYAIWPHMTVFQNVGLPLRAARRPREEIVRRVRDALAMVGLDSFAERSATQLSGGQQQRVALARCIVSEAEFILMDEPLSNLDAKLRIAMRSEIRELQRRLGRTVLFVTHDQEEAMSIADTIFLFRAGRILQSGPPQATYEQPATRYAAEFLGRANILQEFEWCGEGRQAPFVRLRDGTQFPVSPESGFSPGKALCIRPEKWRIADGTEDRRGLPGTITRVSYTGDRCEYAIETPAGVISAVELTGRNRGTGDSVTLSVAPADIKLVSTD
ncbi:MAG: ABC transporter ATP-binding protein [Acidisphaera sp.]|nr:ABC transporter ATP-binding protein [Acidisphaera sp.]